MKSYADYAPFATDDFLSDPAFRVWIASPTPELAAYWRGLLKTNPHLQASFDEARLLAQGLQATWTPFSSTYTEGLYERLQAVLPSIESLQPTTARSRWLLGRSIPQWVYASAVSVAFLLIRLWGYAYFFGEQQLLTGNAKLRTLVLYDGSVVTLGANSRLRVPSRFSWRTERQVWLTGEGSFAVQKVRHDETGLVRKFVVYTHRTDVVVLGTRFTINTRPQRTQVLLEEGRIELSDPKTRETLTLTPGQMVAYMGQRAGRRVTLTTPAQQRSLTAWRDNLLVFDNADMAELATRFREVYGLQLVLRGSAFADQQFRGELPIDDTDKALKILSETFGLKAVQDGGDVYFVTIE